MLLQEMEGLGVLRAIEPDRHTLRNPNILLLLGNRAGLREGADSGTDAGTAVRTGVVSGPLSE